MKVTDLHSQYHPPFPIDPLLPDTASTSDHLGNLLLANCQTWSNLEAIPDVDQQLECLT